MAVFSVNQATHLYKLSSDKTAHTTADGKVYFVADGAAGNGTLRTDLIDKKNVMSITKTTTTAMNLKAIPVQLTLADAALIGAEAEGEEDKVIPGEYVVRIIVNNYYGPSMYDGLIKHAAVFVGANTTVETFFTKLEESINENIKREIEKPFVVSKTESSLTLTPIASEWKLGTKGVVVPTIEVVGVYKDFGNGFEEEWLVDVPTTAQAVANSGSQKLCDLEYFALGERGDQYRGMGWPNVVETKGVLDPKTAYTVFTIHYAHVDSNEAVQKSEKDMVIVATTTDAAAVEEAIEGAFDVTL